MSDEDLVKLKQQIQMIDPREQERAKDTLSLYKEALNEFGWKPPLTMLLYNQVRFFEDYGKLHLGYAIMGREAYAKQFGVSVKQIENGFNNLTNKYHLGGWVVCEEPIFRNVKKIWVSNVRQKRGPMQDFIKMLEVLGLKTEDLLLQRNNKIEKTITAYEQNYYGVIADQTEVGIEVENKPQNNIKVKVKSEIKNIKKEEKPTSRGEVYDFEKEFLEIWKLYPNKKGKSEAQKAYIKARKAGVSKEAVVQGIEAYNTEIHLKQTPERFIKHGSTWFRQKGWEDEYDSGTRQTAYDYDERLPEGEHLTGL